MKKTILICILALLLAIPSCGAQPEEARLTVVCTTYPVYLFASSLTENVDGVAVERLDTGTTSCLHDYTLSMADMKKLERADVIALNGAGLEEFLEDALATSDAAVIDCSEGIPLLEDRSHHHEDGDEENHDGHDHGHWDPHYWMDPRRAAQMVGNLEAGLSALDPDNEQKYTQNSSTTQTLLSARDNNARELLDQYGTRHGTHPLDLITFHDGFQYFADAYGLTLLASIEEEAGSEASAHEIVEITKLVKEHGIPVIFTEVNGSDATAKAISRETGCQVSQLTMLMDGPDSELGNYLSGITGNAVSIINGFAGKEVVRQE